MRARKVISDVYAFFVLQCTLGGKVKTKGMSQPDIKSIFTKIYEIFWSKETFM